MNQGLIPRRYAKALYKVCLERDCAGRCYTLTSTLASSFDDTPGLQSTVANPFVPMADKVKLLTAAAGATAADTTFADFLKLLVKNRRIDIAGDIARAYTAVYRQANHIYRVEVVSAVPMDPAALDRIRQIVDSRLPENSSTEFSSRIDPSLVGGFIVNINNERLDASVSNQLKELRLSLLK